MSIYDTTFSLIYGCLLALITGACAGSFLNCASIRIGREESFVKGRSHCMSCGHDLGVLDLIPVLSWVFLRGRCRYCGERISFRYPLVEIIFALVAMACLLRFDMTVLCLRNFIFLAVLLLLTMTDLDAMIIPDSCHIISVIIWMASAPFLFGMRETMYHVLAGLVFGLGMLALSLLMDRMMKKETLGGGDIKLLAVIGLYFGFIGTLFVLIISCIIGLIYNVCNRREDKKEIPFGPWIAIASAVILFAGDPLIGWYAGLIG